jgi:hypothetical protein
MELKIFQNSETFIVSRVRTFKSNFFEIYEICDGLYNSLLCVIKVKISNFPSHIQKEVFHDQY